MTRAFRSFLVPAAAFPLLWVVASFATTARAQTSHPVDSRGAEVEGVKLQCGKPSGPRG